MAPAVSGKAARFSPVQPKLFHNIDSKDPDYYTI
ncbi:MAG TPA: hypothetical protein DCL38_04230 [Lachnospiraceae bacterium]|nr:hypothetical protein [Lachnospiraceae bacterium]